MEKKFCYLWIICLISLMLIPGCVTAPESVYIDSISDEDLVQLQEVELLLSRYGAEREISLLDQAGDALGQIDTDRYLNDSFAARVYGLRAELYFREQGETPGILNDYIEEVRSLDPYSPYLFILAAFNSGEDEEKIAMLQEGIDLGNSGRIHLFLGDLFYSTGQYPEAAAAYSQGLLTLSEEFAQLYTEKKEVALGMATTGITGQTGSPEESQAMAEIMARETLLLEHTVSYLMIRSSHLESFQPEPGSTAEEVANALISAGWFEFSPIIDSSRLVTRKDIAWMLMQLIADIEQTPELLNLYQQQYTQQGNPSPVPDVSLSDYFFSAVIYLVERDIMRLPDGVHFMPDLLVNGIEYSEAVSRFMRFYP